MIYVTGDCHGDFSRFESDKFSSLTKDDYVIICGDFGGIWDYDDSSKYERKALKKISKMPFTTLFVDGNHENFNRLYNYSIIEWHGGKVHKISNSIFHLMRGEVYELNGKKIFTFGGASSHDIKDGILNMNEEEKIYEYNKRNANFRIRNYNWWDLELPTLEEMNNGINNLKRNNFKIDYIFTHCAPSSIQKIINNYYTFDKLTDYLERINKEVNFKKWYFGHYHENNNTLGNYECLYEDIIEVK